MFLLSAFLFLRFMQKLETTFVHVRLPLPLSIPGRGGGGVCRCVCVCVGGEVGGGGVFYGYGDCDAGSNWMHRRRV